MKSVAFLAILVLSACSNPEREAPYTTAPVPENEAGGFQCSADAAQYAAGQKTSVELAQQLIKKTGARTLRWMPPRTAATMDYRQDRLNIAYDDDMVITRVNCG